MKRHLPRGRWTRETLDGLPWKQLSAISRYRYRRSKALAKRRIHKLERADAKKEITAPDD